MFSIPTPVYQIAWQGPRASQTLRFSIVGDTYRLDPSTAGHVYTSATYMYARYCCSSHFYANRCGCRCNVRWGTVAVNKKFTFRSVQRSFQHSTVTVLTPFRVNVQASCAARVRYRILLVVGGSNCLSTVLVRTNGHSDVCTCEKDGVLNVQEAADSLLVQPRFKTTIHSQSARGGEVELL